MLTWFIFEYQFYMNRKAKIILFQTGLLLFLIALLEIGLRVSGFQPGDMKPKWLNFRPVDSLYVVPDFYTNKYGILVADSNYWAQRNIYINSEGFRTKQFSKLDSGKKKVLLIGDSFTWGMTANPFPDSCFADIMSYETDYEVINLGIPAADPVQYHELAKKFIPKLKPDVVIVIFFAGNDIMKQNRKVIPNEPFYYYTNAGAILADIDGIHFKTAHDAYNYFVNDKYYLKKPKNYFESVISKSSLLSRLYSVRFRIKEKIEYEKTVKDMSITKAYLKQIRQLCLANGVPVKFVFIPEIKEADWKINELSKKYSHLLFDDSINENWLLLQNAKDWFNDYPDAHLNNTGHRHYADKLKFWLNQPINSE